MKCGGWCNLSSILNRVLHCSTQYGGGSSRLSYHFHPLPFRRSTAVLPLLFRTVQALQVRKTLFCFPVYKYGSLFLREWSSWDYLPSLFADQMSQLFFLERAAVAWCQVRSAAWAPHGNIATCVQRWASRRVVQEHQML